MRIEFEFSGGYGGLFAKRPLVLRVDTEDLPEDERAGLLDLVQASGLLDREPARPAGHPGPQRDAFAYRLSIHDGDLAKSFAFDDATVPTDAHPLLAFLRKRAMEQRAKRG